MIASELPGLLLYPRSLLITLPNDHAEASFACRMRILLEEFLQGPCLFWIYASTRICSQSCIEVARQLA